MVRTYIFEAVEGENYIYDPELAYTNLLLCVREGMEYDVIESNSLFEVIGSRQVQHSLSFGFVKFLIPFNTGERVQIIISDI